MHYMSAPTKLTRGSGDEKAVNSQLLKTKINTSNGSLVRQKNAQCHGEQ